MWRKIQARYNYIREICFVGKVVKVKQKEKFSGSYTPCNLIFMTVGDANINTCASSTGPYAGLSGFSLKARKALSVEHFIAL